MTTGVTFPIEYTLKNFHTPKADQYISNFFANNGRIVMAPDNKSFYKSDGHVNGLEKNGTIYIGTQSVDNYAKKMDIPPMWAAKDLLSMSWATSLINSAITNKTPATTHPCPRKSIGA